MKHVKSTLVLAGVLVLSTGGVRAEDSSAPATSPSSRPTHPCNGGTGSGNVQQYCNAAQAAEEASDSNQSAMLVHAAVAATCTAACAGEMTGIPGTYCTIASAGGAAADAIITKNFANSMTGLIGAAGGMLYGGDAANAMGNKVMGSLGASSGAFSQSIPNGASEISGMLVSSDGKVLGHLGTYNNESRLFADQAAADKFSENGAQNDAMACAKAALEGYTTFQRRNDATVQRDVAAKNRRLAEQYNDTGSSSNMTMRPVVTAPSARGSSGGSSPASGGSSPNIAGNTGSATADICNRGSSGDFHAAIQCTVASDKTVPGFVTDPGFTRDLTRATGMSPDAFAKRVAENGAAATLGAAFGAATGNADLGARMGSLYAGLERQIPGPDTGSAYAGTGSGRRGSGDEPGLDKIFNDIMGQFGPKKDQEKSPGVRELAFGGPKRYPANVAEDRRVSIFERVAARYYQVSERVLPAPAGPRVYK